MGSWAKCCMFWGILHDISVPQIMVTLTQMQKNIHILQNFRKFDQNVHFGEFEPNIWKIGNIHQDTQKNVHISEKMIYFLQEIKYVLYFCK